MSYSPYKLPQPHGLRALAGRVKAAILRRVLADDTAFTTFVAFFPRRLFVFNTTICNARCSFCPQSTHIDEKRVMEFGLFRKVLDEFVSKGGTRITLNPNNGDPLVDPDFVEKLKAARAANAGFIDLNTNAILLGRGDTAATLAACANRIGISLPGFDREDYKRVYGVDRAEAVLSGIEKLAQIKRETGSKISIELALRIDRPLEEVLADEGMKRLKPYLDDGTVIIDYEELYMEMETWSDQITADRLPGTMTLRTDAPLRSRPCKRMMSDLALLVDGSIRVCGCRYHTTNYDQLVVGDTKTQPLEEIFMGKTHRTLLQRTSEGDWPKACQGCTLYQPQDYPRTTWLAMAAQLVRSRFRRP